MRKWLLIGLVLAAIGAFAYWSTRPSEQSGSKAVAQGGQIAKPEDVLKQARALLKRAKQGLTKAGKYSCCIDPGCDFCPLAMGNCPCSETIEQKGFACPECVGGWQAGHGSMRGIKAENVKMPPKDMLKKAYDMRAKLAQ